MSASCASLSNGSRIYGKNGATPPYNKTRLRLALRWLCLYVLQNENENERSTLSLCHHNNSLSRTKVPLKIRCNRLSALLRFVLKCMASRSYVT